MKMLMAGAAMALMGLIPNPANLRGGDGIPATVRLSA